MSKRRIALITTGGTIEKTYNEFSGLLSNQISVLDVMLASLELNGVDIERLSLMNKDSLDMSPGEHALIAFTLKTGPARPASPGTPAASARGSHS